MHTALSRLLPYLPVLACSVLMVVCMLGMRAMGSRPHQPERPSSQAAPSTTPPALLAERVAQLEQELAAVRGDTEGPARAIPETEDAQPARQPKRVNRS